MKREPIHDKDKMPIAPEQPMLPRKTPAPHTPTAPTYPHRPSPPYMPPCGNQPGWLPPYVEQPRGEYPGMMPPNQQPGMMPPNQQPGMMPPMQQPGMMPPMQQPGMMPPTMIDHGVRPGWPVMVDTNFLQGYLQSIIGSYVKVDFILGTNMFIDREGTLVDVGVDHIVLREPQTDNLIVADLYSIKFVRVYR